MKKLCLEPRHLGLIAIFAVGLLLRTWGISWGLPVRTDLHPDEHDYVLTHALELSWSHRDPGFLNYPAFLMYLISLTFGALKHLGVLSGAEWQAYLIGRLWSALFAGATVFPVYKIAKELGGTVRSALLAALFMALFPLNVWEGHVAVTDPLMTFWTTMTLWASVRLVRTGTWRDYAFAGACLGLATGSKYTAAIVVVAVIAGAFASRRPLGATLQGLVIAGAISLACAFAVMPYSFLRFPDLLAAMKYESNHTTSHHFGFSLPASGWQYHRGIYQLVAMFPFCLGFALYAASIGGTLWVLVKFDRRKLPLFAFAAAFLFVLVRWYFVPIRYYMPLLVLGPLFTGLWIGALLDSQKFRCTGIALLIATLGYTSVFSAQTAARYAHETRDEAGHWLDKKMNPGGSLLVCGWSRYAALPQSPDEYKISGGKDDAPVRKLPGDAPYDLIEITSLHADRHFRQGEDGWINAYKRLRDPNGPFTRVAKFESHFINKRLYTKLDPMYAGYFVSPTLEFYRAKNPAHETNAPPAKP